MRELEELVVFLANQMQMSEVYQPAIILYLLEQGGCASKGELARVLSGYDESVQDYYARILMRWPKQTLARHEVLTYDRKAREFCLNFALGDPQLVERAKALCEARIEQWIEERARSGEDAGVTASTRYRVLKAARGKCELCGIPAKLAPIDIDHIVPASQADRRGYVVIDGVAAHKDDERNLQALCFRCNRAKRDQDATDFRLPRARLVRDRVPEEIRASGRRPVVQQVRGRAYRDLLFDKLVEEHSELQAEATIEEVADMVEVLFGIGATLGYEEAATLEVVPAQRERLGGPLGALLPRPGP